MVICIVAYISVYSTYSQEITLCWVKADELIFTSTWCLRRKCYLQGVSNCKMQKKLALNHFSKSETKRIPCILFSDIFINIGDFTQQLPSIKRRKKYFQSLRPNEGNDKSKFYFLKKRLLLSVLIQRKKWN